MKNTPLISKRKYNKPDLYCIQIDNEITLVLQTLPPEGPFESENINHLYNPNSFKNQIS